MTTKTVRDPSAAYLAMRPKWDKAAAILGGTDALRAAGETYLPRQPAESAMSYQMRLERSFLTAPGFKKAIAEYVDKVFQRDIEVENNTGVLGDILDDTDGRGNDITVFTRAFFRDALIHGLSHVQVGMSDQSAALAEIAAQGRPVTLADRDRMGVRPFLILRPAVDVIGWRGAEVQGRMELRRVRILETYDEAPESQWDDDNERVQVRVLEPGRWEIWRELEPGGRARGMTMPRKREWTMVLEGETNPIGFVPLVTLYFDDAHGFMTADPPLDELADLNLCHWQSGSDQRNLLRVARVPILFGRGFTSDEVQDGIVISGNTAVFSTSPQADLSFVEHAGTALQSGSDDLKALEDAMASWTRAFQEEPAAPMAAASKAIDEADTHTRIQAMAKQTADAINQALDMACEWMRAPAGSVRININVESPAENIMGEGGGPEPVRKIAANAR